MARIKKLADKFYGNKPLADSLDYYPDDMLLNHNQIEWIPHEMEFCIHTMMGKSLKKEAEGRILLFAVRAQEEKLKKFDFLNCPDGPAVVWNKRVVDKLNELCPGDFESFPVEIRNLKPEDIKDKAAARRLKWSEENYANHDFHLINILHRIDVIDREKTTIEDWGDNFYNCRKIHFKEDSMQGHLLARDDLTGFILFDPKLAREFVKSKGIAFMSDEENRRINF